MSTNSNTVVSLKSAFLRTQTRILSQPLQAPGRWRASNLSASDIPESVVKDVIREVNRLIRRHNKSAFPSLAIRHVADQIDALYWTAAAPPLSLPQDADAAAADADDGDGTPTLDPLHPSADLTASATIAALAPTWAEAIDRDPARVPEGDKDAGERYEELVQRLQALDEKRALLRRKLERYKRVREGVEALREPREVVQRNLVTRDGELARGVAEVKTLGVRVEELDREWKGRSKSVERKKLEGLLDD
ncbi:kinetochore Sim4 complex subunit Fta4 [Macrophomina phaseolina]|uniref:Kinetochore Sim4 complex subunit Fta4 n=1 Tax=Macrophomina phaseolina TaxID=35725 RepID=A0ABQ8GAS9_9PEZI|nr:kinetochore Sim4 complex subunit Fta4 [Macrophomina phaseolina]